MTEVQFAKQFLTTLDSKNTKYQADHVFDQKTFVVRTPYTLPKLQHPPHPLPPKILLSASSSSPAPGSLTASASAPETTLSGSILNLTLKSTRNPTFTLNLPSLPTSTPITTLRTQIQFVISTVGTIPLDKIKILHNKKPIPPTKITLEDVIPSTDGQQPEVEFSVMVMGGAPDPSPQVQTIRLNQTQAAPWTPAPVQPISTPTANATSDPVQPGAPSGHEILQTPDFWDDLQGFLEQRLKDTTEAQNLRALFEKAVKAR